MPLLPWTCVLKNSFSPLESFRTTDIDKSNIIAVSRTTMTCARNKFPIPPVFQGPVQVCHFSFFEIRGNQLDAPFSFLLYRFFERTHKVNATFYSDCKEKGHPLAKCFSGSAKHYFPGNAICYLLLDTTHPNKIRQIKARRNLRAFYYNAYFLSS